MRIIDTAFFGVTARILPSPSGRNTFSTQRTPFPLLPMLPLSPSATHIHPLILTLKTWPILAVFVVLGPRHKKHGRNGRVSSLLTLRSSKWGPGRQTPVFCHAGSFRPHLHPSHHHRKRSHPHRTISAASNNAHHPQRPPTCLFTPPKAQEVQCSRSDA